MTGDRQLARRLAREARASARAEARLRGAQAAAQRSRERARRRLPSRALVTALAGSGALATEALDGLLWPVALLAGVGTVRAVRALRRPAVPAPPPRPFAPAVAGPPPVLVPPGTSSAAWPAVRRLEAVRVELGRLLPLVAPAGRAAAEEAWHAAAEADAALRWQAARLAAVEPHLGAEPGLLAALEEGVACQERLVQAVADLVAASADPLSSGRLQSATDALHGLAHGLRELRGDLPADGVR